MKEKKLLAAQKQEKYFLNAFPLVHKIAARRFSSYFREIVDDISQKVMLRLWSWKTKRGEEIFSEESWRKIANRTVQNEIKRYRTDKSQKEVSLSEHLKTGALSRLAGKPSQFQVEGNTDAELRSLLLQVWISIQKQSMREKYSLLLKKAELIRYLVSHDCCKIKEITDELKLGREEFIEIYRSLPLSDQEIAHLLERKLGTPITAGNVLKARQRARAKIRRAISVKAPHERTFIRRKT